MSEAKEFDVRRQILTAGFEYLEQYVKDLTEQQNFACVKIGRLKSSIEVINVPNQNQITIISC